MSKAILFAVTIPVLAVLAQVTPSEPAPGNVYNQGSTCNVQWEIDPTGQWTEMNIQLMTGSNTGMVHLTTVATVDGTRESSFSYTCPAVSPNSAIYFYQFSSPAAPGSLTWTGRFAIADADGNTTPPPEEADGIQFGTGALSDPSSASPAPSYLGGGGGGGGTVVVTNTADSTGGGTNSASENGSVEVTTSVQTVPPNSATGALTATGSLTRSAGPTRLINPDSDGASESGTATETGSGEELAQGTSTTSASSASALVHVHHDLKSRSLKTVTGLVGIAVIFATMF